ERAHPGLDSRIVRRARQKHAGLSHPLGLRACREWQSDRRTSEKRDELAPPHYRPRSRKTGIVAAQTCTGKGPTYVGFGSKADICTAPAHVRFTPNSDRKSGLPQTVMSALPLKADIRSQGQC